METALTLSNTQKIQVAVAKSVQAELDRFGTVDLKSRNEKIEKVTDHRDRTAAVKRIQDQFDKGSSKGSELGVVVGNLITEVIHLTQEVKNQKDEINVLQKENRELNAKIQALNDEFSLFRSTFKEILAVQKQNLSLLATSIQNANIDFDTLVTSTVSHSIN